MTRIYGAMDILGNVDRCFLSISTILVFLLLTSVTTQQYYTAAQEEAFFKIAITFIEGEDRNVDDARVYVQEYPQYGTTPPNGSYIDLNDAFYNDDPYTGIWEDEIVVPSGLIGREDFHVCIEDTNKGITLACYKLQNAETMGSEKLTIDFNNFP
jgi:hypothetical protein